MSLLNIKDKAIIELLSRQHGTNSLFLRLLGKNKGITKALHKYYTRPIVAADVAGGKIISGLLGNIKGKGKVAKTLRRASMKFWSNETPIMLANGKMSIIPRVPLMTAPLGHARDIVMPAAAIIGGGYMANALSGLNRNRKKVVMREDGKRIGHNGSIENIDTNYKVVPKEEEGGFFYE